MTVDIEVCQYMKTADMGNLHNFPRILKIFLKTNTATPSSAPVERLFSIGSLILTPKMNHFTDQCFERLLLLWYNHYVEKKEPWWNNEIMKHTLNTQYTHNMYNNIQKCMLLIFCLFVFGFFAHTLHMWSELFCTEGILFWGHLINILLKNL